ncbi:Uncharacterized protein QTN25_007353 [Entamoeba marina]
MEEEWILVDKEKKSKKSNKPKKNNPQPKKPKTKPLHPKDKTDDSAKENKQTAPVVQKVVPLPHSPNTSYSTPERNVLPVPSDKETVLKMLEELGDSSVYLPPPLKKEKHRLLKLLESFESPEKISEDKKHEQTIQSSSDVSINEQNLDDEKQEVEVKEHQEKEQVEEPKTKDEQQTKSQESKVTQHKIHGIQSIPTTTKPINFSLIVIIASLIVVMLSIVLYIEFW